MLIAETLMRRSVPFLFAFLLAGCQIVAAQDVVSASAGVLHYFEGTVILDDKPIEHKAAVFPSLNNESTLKTEKGRAELMLTPGAYLRLDDNSAIRMVSNSLVKTRLDLTKGSAIVDTLNATAADALVLSYEGSEVRFPKPGIYRLDSDVGELQVYSGECTVTRHGASTTVDSSHLYYFLLQITTRKFGDGATDEFYDWASNRSDVIADQNQLASADQNDALGTDPGNGGSMYVVPPIYASPGYATPATPLFGYSQYGGGVNNPFYVYQQSPYSPFASSLGVILLPPFRHRPGGSRWPVTIGAGYRPGSVVNGSVVTRWPSSTQGLLSPLPSSGLRYPVHSPIMRPSSPTMRMTAPSITAPHAAAPHISAPHIGGGHR